MQKTRLKRNWRGQIVWIRRWNHSGNDKRKDEAHDLIKTLSDIMMGILTLTAMTRTIGKPNGKTRLTILWTSFRSSTWMTNPKKDAWLSMFEAVGKKYVSLVTDISSAIDEWTWKKCTYHFRLSSQTAVKYRKDWDKNNFGVKILQSFMPKRNSPDERLPSVFESTVGITVPPAVKYAVKQAGYAIKTDYKAKKCVKIGTKIRKGVRHRAYSQGCSCKTSVRTMIHN